MAKSQKRNSREPKKPKADKKPAAVAQSSFLKPTSNTPGSKGNK